MKKRIGVIGAGISGLACAYELDKAGHEVTVFEKESFVGGRMSTRQPGDLPFDIGADHLGNAYTHMQEYCKELGIPWVPMKNPKYAIYREGKLYPSYKVVGWFSRMRLALYAWLLKNTTNLFHLSSATKYDTGTAYDFMKKVAGKESAEYLANGITEGYQFHSSKEASKGSFIAYMQSIKFNDWRLHKTEGGMIAISQAIANKLDVKLNTEVIEVHQGEKKQIKTKDAEYEFDVIVLACTPNIGSKILQDQTSLQKDLLENSHFAATISLAYHIDADLLPEETNLFTPSIESKTIASYTNQKMKGEEWMKDGKSLLCAWLHEDYAKEIFELDDDEILRRCRHELAKVCPWLTREDQLEPYTLYKWTHAMPKFSQGHLTRVKNFEEQEQGKNQIWFAGDYLNSPWTEGALRCGQRVAKQIMSQ